MEQREVLIVALIVVAALVILWTVFGRRRKPTAPVITDPFERLKHALSKTRGGLLDALRRTLGGEIDEAVIDSLEEILIRSDIGVDTTERLLDGLKAAYRKGELSDVNGVLDFLKARLKEQLGASTPS